MRRRSLDLDAILKSALPGEIRERVYSVELLRLRWRDAVGHELALRSEPESLEGRVLTVRVTDPAWGRMIYKLQNRIVPALNRALGTDRVRRLNFVRRSELRNRPEATERAVARTRSVAPDSLRHAAQAIADPELRERVLASAASYLTAQRERKEKWKS